MLWSIVVNLVVCLVVTASLIFVVTFRVAAIKTRSPAPGESRHVTNSRLWSAHKAELRRTLSSPLLWTIAAIITALIIARGITSP